MYARFPLEMLKLKQMFFKEVISDGLKAIQSVAINAQVVESCGDHWED